ncbi:hypothetical protein [Roseovarius sp. 2305UL8-3]|uniref:hypothetical protein n=1 Tax=Roseovarius conchicola TaxID=3121636 RepID=UPI0035270381
MARTLCGGLLLALMLLTGPATAASQVETPRTGLLWHRSGLPATFPLQIKTLPGDDYYLTLIDAETQNAVLAAYIEGGAFFRILVPPGVFILRFEHGRTWYGEDERFGSGPEAGVFVLDTPLEFAVEGVNRKAGHLVDLRGVFQRDAIVDVWPDAICQSVSVTLEPSPGAEALPLEKREEWEFPYRELTKDPLEAARERVQRVPPRLIRRTEVRTRICG